MVPKGSGSWDGKWWNDTGGKAVSGWRTSGRIGERLGWSKPPFGYRRDRPPTFGNGHGVGARGTSTRPVSGPNTNGGARKAWRPTDRRARRPRGGAGGGRFGRVAVRRQGILAVGPASGRAIHAPGAFCTFTALPPSLPSLLPSYPPHPVRPSRISALPHHRRFQDDGRAVHETVKKQGRPRCRCTRFPYCESGCSRGSSRW